MGCTNTAHGILLFYSAGTGKPVFPYKAKIIGRRYAPIQYGALIRHSLEQDEKSLGEFIESLEIKDKNSKKVILRCRWKLNGGKLIRTSKPIAYQLRDKLDCDVRICIVVNFRHHTNYHTNK